MINETAADKIVAALARNNGEWVRAYLEHFPREVRTNKAVRERLAEVVHPAVLHAIMELHPWLADESNDGAPVERVREMLDKARTAGVRGSAIRAISGGDLALKELLDSGEVLSNLESTGGRPAETYRLKIHDKRFNPFAR